MEYVCPILERVTPVEETSFSKELWSIVRCRETGFVFLSNPPDYSQLETEFAWEKTSQMEMQRRAIEEPIVTRISKIAKKTKRTVFPKRNKIATLACSELESKDAKVPFKVLDIGCGEGGLLVEVSNRCEELGREIIPYGVEVSRQLAAEAQENVADRGGNIICSNAVDSTSQFESESIHLVIMCSFLEHECHPLSLLKRLHSVIANDGSIVLKVPNYECLNRMIRGRRWCGFRFPDHVNYFTPKTLSRLAAEAGFTVSRQGMLDKFPLSDNMYAVLRKSA